MAKERRYWDTDCFFGYLQEEEGKYDLCKSMITLAEKGEIEIVTSALTIADVLYLRPNKKKVPPEDAKKISDFFKRDYILIVELDRVIAEEAQALYWKHEALDTKDAVHVATAIKVHADTLDTFDSGLLKLTGQMGNPPLPIVKPDKPQQSLSFAENEE